MPRVRRADCDFRWVAGSSLGSCGRILDLSQSLTDGGQVSQFGLHSGNGCLIRFVFGVRETPAVSGTVWCAG